MIVLVIAGIGPLFLLKSANRERPYHNCRLWGIILPAQKTEYSELIHRQLDSLKALGVNNPDGWGIGYYLQISSGQTIPIISRGEPNSINDQRYDRIVDELVNYIDQTGIVHIRRGTSGPTSGIPDPHPFRRFGVYRNFDMLFAHNGYIPTDILLNLINALNPDYLNLNPPDYNPQYLDSDLFSIFLIEIIDMYPDSSIESCIRLATTKLDSGLGNEPAQLNFVMCNDSCLWALHFAEIALESYTLFYFPDTGASETWVVASEPLDTFSLLWQAVPNSTMVRVKPGEPIQFYPIYQSQTRMAPRGHSIFLYPIPCHTRVNIVYILSSAVDVEFKFYDISGRLVDEFNKEGQKPGSHSFSWPREDRVLPDGSYFCLFRTSDSVITTKLILLN